MSLEITYWADAIHGNPIPSHAILSETRSTSGSSAASGACPPGARVVSIVCTGAADRFEIGSGTPVATAASAYIGVGERIWTGITPGYKVAGITA